jgi:hypothetical protein
MGTAIYTGPQGCGETTRAPAIAQRYGCAKVVDDWLPGDPIAPGALHITHLPVVQSDVGHRAIVVQHEQLFQGS